MADIAKRQKLQADAGLTHLPTELTYELRMAVTGHRADEFLSWGYQWTDKPHRLVYEACGVVEAQAVEIESLYAEVERLESDLADALTDLNTARQDNASFGPELKRLKSELLQRDMTWLPAKDAEIARLKAEVARKDAALEPFAEMGRAMMGRRHHMEAVIQFALAPTIKVHHLVAAHEARAALTQEKTNDT